ncbi:MULTISPECIES: hypothetical protein [Cytobacillus]|uniref:Uncharacterized protein n=2 Tax=Bacillati TaxID=1783272 RepID=A0A2N0ZMY2_9BACI|nr:hypothetical protein [Cytobacillus horneckiae]MEC1159285.1 hypothetical protein [Cytobacillus horneckiae]PKG30879.1 hypothetical protein CWS20_00870 [Cytobacillus horneckiae]
MNYQLLKQPRSFLTKEEVAEHKSLVTFTIYNDILDFTTGKGGEKKNTTQTVILEPTHSPLTDWSLPKNEEAFNRDIIKKIEDIELAHQVASLYRMEQPFQHMMDEIRIELLRTSVQTLNRERFLYFIANVLIPLIPSLKEKRKPIPFVLPIRSQKGNTEKKADKYRYYFKAIKKIQLFYSKEQVIYLEGNDNPLGLLILFSNEQKPFGSIPLIPEQHARSIDEYRKYLGTAPYPLS